MLQILVLALLAHVSAGLTSHRIVNVERIEPYAPNNLFAVLDVNRTRMRATNMYTEAQITAVDTGSKQHMLTEFGLDFFNSQVGVFGGLFYPNVSNAIAVMIPYTIGLDANFPTNRNFTRRVIFDSANLGRGATEDWAFVGCGNLVLMLQSGTFTSGTNAGASYVGGPLGVGPQTQDGLGYASYNFVRADYDWTKPWNRDELIMKTPWTVKQFLNQRNEVESLSKVLVTDLKSGKVGYGLLVGTFADPFGNGYSAISPLNIMFSD